MIDINKPLRALIFDADDSYHGTTELEVDVQAIILQHTPYTERPEIIYNGGRSQVFDLLPQNLEPLTQQELRDMAGEPVYCPDMEAYGIIKYETIGLWAGILFLVGVYHGDSMAVDFEYNITERNLKCYRLNEN